MVSPVYAKIQALLGDFSRQHDVDAYLLAAMDGSLLAADPGISGDIAHLAASGSALLAIADAAARTADKGEAMLVSVEAAGGRLLATKVGDDAVLMLHCRASVDVAALREPLARIALECARMV